MKVNGEAFRKAREEIRKDSPKRRGKPGQPAKGTQEWLAGLAIVLNEEQGEAEPKWKPLSVRTIQALEKGEASIETVDAVSPHLGINGRELIIGYGKENVVCRAVGNIDFRPAAYPINNRKDFFKSPLMITIDPLEFVFNTADIDTFHIKNISLSLGLFGFHQEFTWLYEVSLTQNSSKWLGIIKEVYPFSIHLCENQKIINIPIMFSCQDVNAISWEEFVDRVEESNDGQITINMEIRFSNFEKNIKILCSLELLKINFQKGRKIRKSIYPYKTHVKIISVDC